MKIKVFNAHFVLNHIFPSLQMWAIKILVQRKQRPTVKIDSATKCHHSPDTSSWIWILRCSNWNLCLWTQSLDSEWNSLSFSLIFWNNWWFFCFVVLYNGELVQGYKRLARFFRNVLMFRDQKYLKKKWRWRQNAERFYISILWCLWILMVHCVRFVFINICWFS